MIPEAILPLVRRAILDCMFDTGGELNDDELTILLKQLGHRRVARSDVADQLRWLAEGEFVVVEDLGPYVVARILSKGRDIADGSLVVDGVWRHKTGD